MDGDRGAIGQTDRSEMFLKINHANCKQPRLHRCTSMYMYIMILINFVILDYIIGPMLLANYQDYTKNVHNDIDKVCYFE